MARTPCRQFSRPKSYIFADPWWKKHKNTLLGKYRVWGRKKIKIKKKIQSSRFDFFCLVQSRHRREAESTLQACTLYQNEFSSLLSLCAAWPCSVVRPVERLRVWSDGSSAWRSLRSTNGTLKHRPYFFAHYTFWKEWCILPPFKQKTIPPYFQFIFHFIQCIPELDAWIIIAKSSRSSL